MGIDITSTTSVAYTRTVQSRIRRGGYSEFFRIRGQADLWSKLSSHLALPNGGNPKTVVSVGCSTGEEPYSVAILADFMGLNPQPRVIGIDLSTQRIAQAQTGVYKKSRYIESPNLAIPSQYFTYFIGLNDPGSPTFSVSPTVREKVEFIQGDISRPDSLPKRAHQADIVLALNLIPGSREIQFDIRAGLSALLRPGGILIINHETA